MQTPHAPGRRVAFAMAMTIAGKGGGGFDVERALDFEKRSSAKDGDIETFITKVDAVNAAIQAMKASASRRAAASRVHSLRSF